MEARDLFSLVGVTIAGKFRVERVLGEGGFVVVIGVSVALVMTRSPGASGPAASPPAPVAAPAPVAPLAPLASAGPGPKLVVAGVIGTDPFWNQGEIMDVARTHHAEMIACAREAVSAETNLVGGMSVTVSPDKRGVVESVQCSMRAGRTIGAVTMCGCVEATMGRWRYPAAHGRLGLLDSGSFIYDYRLFAP